MNFSKVSIITGHYGSGKTNFAVNLALETAKAGHACVVIDLDIVNPYFRTADFSELFSYHGIKLYAPIFSNTNLDIPALNIDINGILNGDEYIIIDVGGDDAGAYALGRFSSSLSKVSDFQMLYVINCYRYLTKRPDEALHLLREIENVSRLSCTGIVNNSNLGKETTLLHVAESLSYADAVSNASFLPIIYTCALKNNMPDQAKNPFFIDLYVKPIWEI